MTVTPTRQSSWNEARFGTELTRTSTGVEDFRQACRMHPAGISIVTVAGPTGPVGFTASSLAGLSAQPALFSFNIGRQSSSLSALLAADTAIVHLLGTRSSELATRFAGPAAQRFSGDLAWRWTPTGEPEIDGVRARLRVGLERFVEAGDHLLVIASLLDFEVLDESDDPVVNADGGFHGLRPV